MKKLYVIFMLVAVMLTVSGCQGREKIGLCLRQNESHPSAWLERELKACFQEKGWKAVSCDACNDQSRQNRQIAELLDDACDLLIVEPVMTAASPDILRQAQAADVPVIFLNFAPERTLLETWNRAYYIGSDLTQPGLLQSQLIRQLPDGGDSNGDGSVAYTVISGPEDHVDATRWTQDCGRDIKGVRLSEDHGDWSRDSGRKICWQQLARHEVEVIFCNSDELALGALEAMQGEEKAGYLVGIGGDKQVLTHIQNGTMTGTISPDVPELIRRVTATADVILSGGQPEKEQLLDFVAVTGENVDMFLP